MAKRLNYQIGIVGDTKGLEAAVDKAVTSLNKLGTANFNSTRKNLAEGAKAAQQLSQHLQDAFNASTGRLDLTTFNNSLKKSGMTIDQYADKLGQLGPLGKEAFLNVAQAVGQAELPLKRSNQLLNSLWVTMKNTARWQLTSSALHGFMGAVQTAYGYTKDLNESLNSIRIVTAKSTEEMAKFAQKANDAAKALSTTTTNYTDASLIYYQQGLSDEEVEARTNITIKLANAAGEAAETASEQLTAVWNNFADGSKNLEYFADVMTALGATTASSTQEISQGLSKFAAIADTVGLSYEYAASALATVTAVTRESADTVGTAFRTIFGRLEGLKLGETLEDGTDLTKYSLALQRVGINIKDVNGNLKDMDIILDETMDKWKTLTRDQQMGLAQTVAGVRQYAQFIALMDNADFFRENLATAQGAEGSLQKQADIYAESWEAARDRVKAASQDIYDSLINDQAFIDMDNALTPFLTGVANVTDALGGLKGLLTIVGFAVTRLYSGQIAQGLRDTVTNLGIITGLEGERARNTQLTFATLADQLNVEAEDDILLKAKLTTLQDQVELQSIINKHEGEYSAEQLKQIEGGQHFLDLLKQQTLEIADQAQKRKETYEELKGEALNYIKQTDTKWRQTVNSGAGAVQASSGFKEGSSQALYLKSVYQDIVKTTQASNGKDQTEVWNALIRKLEETKGHIRELDKIQKMSAEEGAKEWAKFAESVGLVDIKLEDAGKVLNKEAAMYSQSLQNLSDKPELIGQISSAFDKAAASEEAATKKVEQFGAAAEDAFDLVSNPNTDKDWASTITSISSGLMGLNMAVQGLKNIGQIWDNNDLKPWEKLLQILTSLTMILPALATLSKTLAAAQDVEALKTGLLTKAKVAKALASKAEAIANEKVTETEVIKTAATNMYLLAITAVVAAIWIAVRAIEKQNKAFAESAEKYKEAKDKLKEYKDELKSTQDEITELNDKIADGSAVDADYERLKILERQNQVLERQVQLQERLAKIAYDERLRNAKKQDNTYITPNNSGSSAAQKYFNIRFQNSGEFDLDDAETKLYSDLSSITTSQGLEEWYLKATEMHKDDEALLGKIQKAYEGYLTEYNANIGEWIDQNKEAYENKETRLETLIEALENGDIGLDNEALTTTIREVNAFRKIIYGDKYEDTFLTPLINDLEQLSKSDFDKLLAGDIANISESAKRKIALGGVSATDVSAQIQKIKKDADAQLARYGLTDSGALGYSEWKILAKFEAEGVNDIETVLNSLGAGVNVPVAVSMDAMGDAVLEALTKLSNGELLGDEEIKKLQDAATALGMDLSHFAELAVNDQIQMLGEIQKQLNSTLNGDAIEGGYAGEYYANAQKALTDLQDSQKALESDENRYQLLLKEREDIIADLADDAKNYNQANLDSTNAEIKALSRAHSDYAILDRQISETEKNLQSLKDKFAKNPWEINFHIDPSDIEDAVSDVKEAFDSRVFAAELANTRKALALINEDLTVSAQNLVELGKRAPEALANATYDSANNVLRINQEMYDSMMSAADGYLDHKRDLAVQELLDQVKTEAGILQVIDIAENQKRDADNTTLAQKLQNNEISETNIKDAAQRIAKVAIQQEIEKCKADIETRKQQITTSKTTEETATSSLQAVGKNAEATAKNLQAYFESALTATSTNFLRFATNPFGFTKAAYNYAQKEANDNKGTIASSADVNAAIANDAEIQRLNQQIESLTTVMERLEAGDDFSELLNLADEGFGYIDQDFREQYGDTAYNYLQDYAKARQQDKTSGDTSGSQAFIENYAKNHADIISAAETAGKTMAETANEVIQSLLEPIITEKKKSGSGSTKTASETKVADDLEDTVERYHEITLEIEEQDDLLKKLDTDIGRAYGVKRLDQFKRKIEELNKQAENYDKKAKEAREKYLPRDLERAKAAAAGYGFDISQTLDEHGDISNYTEILSTAYDQLDAANKSLQEAQNAYNALAGRDQDDTEVKEAKARIEEAQKTLDASQKAYKELEKALSQYEDTLKIERENIEKREQALRDARDAELEKINYTLEVKLDIKQLKDDLRDFEKQIAESFGDALTHTLTSRGSWWRGVADINKERAESEMAMYDSYLQQYNELKAYLASDEGHTDMDKTRESMANLVQEMISSGGNLLEWLDYWENMLPEALSAARERLDKFTNQLAHNTTILDIIKELYVLQGQSYKSEEGFARLQKIGQTKMDAQLAKAEINKKWADELEGKVANAQKELDAYVAANGETGVQYDYLVKARDALLQEFNDAQEAYLTSAKEAMETARDMYKLSIEKAVYDFDQAVSGGQGLDLLSEKYDHLAKESELYYDTVNEMYQTASWYSKLQQDIDKTSDAQQKERLKALQEEVDVRREGGTLSEYDMKYLEAKYKILQASAELEDAQNNATELRLARDSQGNWNYQYTANVDDIAEKQQQLMNAANEAYNLAKNRSMELSQEITQIEIQYRDALAEIWQDVNMNDEAEVAAAQARTDELTEHTQTMLDALGAEFNNVQGDIEQAATYGILATDKMTEQLGIDWGIIQGQLDQAKAAITSTNSNIDDLLIKSVGEFESAVGIAAQRVHTEVTDTIKQNLEQLGVNVNEMTDAEILVLANKFAQGGINLGATMSDNLAAKIREALTGDTGEDIKTVVDNLTGEQLNGIITSNGELMADLMTENVYQPISSSISDLSAEVSGLNGSWRENLLGLTPDTNKFSAASVTALTNIQTAGEKLGQVTETIADKTGTSIDTLDSKVQDVSDSNEYLYDTGMEVVDMLGDQIDAVYDAAEAWREFADEVENAIQLLYELAAAQVNDVETNFHNGVTYNKNVDYSNKMKEAYAAGDMEAYQQYYAQRNAKISGEKLTDVLSTARVDRIIRAAAEDPKVAEIVNSHYFNEDLIKALEAAGYSFSTGGYTGEWGPEAKLAAVHEKELILNTPDTENILAAVDMVRNISKLLDEGAQGMIGSLIMRLGGINLPAASSQSLDQTIHIDEVSFPNITSADGIEEAFRSLADNASQWVSRRGD